MNKYLAEFTGTLMLVTAVVGSGIMATQLTQDIGLQLLVNAISTTLVLAIIIVLFKETSGAHFNPAVTLVALLRKKLALKQAAGYVVGQLIGGLIGVTLAHAMFGLAIIETSTHSRSGMGLLLGELVATFGLVIIVLKPNIKHEFFVPAWICGAYFFTSSTSFANPAVTISRAFTDSFAGISPSSLTGFISAQLIGALIGLGYSKQTEGKNA